MIWPGQITYGSSGMCIVALTLGAHPRWPILILANRDEHHARAAAPLARWEDGSGVIAGRDMIGGGTWLGVNEARARIVLVTNYRVPGYPLPDRPSRGGLVCGLLAGADPLAVPIAAYNPFHLVALGPSGATYLASHPAERREMLPPGIHGLSNGAFETPWPKTRQLTADLAGWLAGPADDPETLIAFLAAETPTLPAGSAWNPHGPDPEPRLSPVFIRDAAYGTRCSTIIAVAADGEGSIIERRFAPTGEATGETRIGFRWPAQGSD